MNFTTLSLFAPQQKTGQAFNPEDPLTLELQHGSQRQAVQLPTDTLDKSKKYYVTFTLNHSPVAAAGRAKTAELGVEGKSAMKGRQQQV